MADIKISEMEELLPYDDLLATGGVSGEDFLTILDIDETEPAKLNKKVKVSTVLEKHALINSPNFTGNPKVPTPDIALNNTNNIVNVSWVVEKLQLQTLPDLVDVTSNLNPQDGQTLVFDGLSNEWKAGSATTTSRETLSTSKTLSSLDATYQFLIPNQDVDVVLPSGSAGNRFVIKNLNPNNGSLFIKEGSQIVGMADTNTIIVECIHDGVEWHVLSM